MTDEQIMKAFERCKTYDDLRACYKCPALENGDCSNGKTYISDFIAEKFIDLIKRKDAEIERLQHYKQSYVELKAEHLELIRSIKTCQIEAIKELAERLKRWGQYSDDFNCYAVAVPEIDNTVKEMVGDE